MEIKMARMQTVALFEWACDNCHSVYYSYRSYQSRGVMQCPDSTCASKLRYCGKVVFHLGDGWTTLEKLYEKYHRGNNPHDFDRFIRACEKVLT